MKNKISFEKFSLLLTEIKAASDTHRKLYDLGVDLTGYAEPYFKATKILGEALFGVDDWDTIQWFIYESELGTNEEFTMHDKEGNRLCTTIRDTYELVTAD